MCWSVRELAPCRLRTRPRPEKGARSSDSSPKKAGDIGNSPLQYAVLNNEPQMAEFLILNGANVWLKNEYGDTPIDFMDGNEAFSKIQPKPDGP